MRESLEFLREHLPDHDPWHVWSTSFVDDDGKVNKVVAGVTGVVTGVAPASALAATPGGAAQT